MEKRGHETIWRVWVGGVITLCLVLVSQAACNTHLPLIGNPTPPMQENGRLRFLATTELGIHLGMPFATITPDARRNLDVVWGSGSSDPLGKLPIFDYVTF